MADIKPFDITRKRTATQALKFAVDDGGFVGNITKPDLDDSIVGGFAMDVPIAGVSPLGATLTGTLELGADHGRRAGVPIIGFWQFKPPGGVADESRWKSFDYTVTATDGTFAFVYTITDFDLTNADVLIIAQTMLGNATRKRSNVITLTSSGVPPIVEIDATVAVGAGPGNGFTIYDVNLINTPNPSTVVWSITSGDMTGLALNTATGAITVSNSAAVTLASSPRTLVVRATNSAGHDEMTLTVNITGQLNPKPPTSAAAPMLLGSYTFQGTIDRTEVENFWGYKENYALEFATQGGKGQNPSPDINDMVSSAIYNCIGHWNGKGKKLVLTLNTTCHDHVGTEVTLADVANGAHDAALITIGNAAVANGFPDCVFRLFHEFNGGWYQHGVNQFNPGHTPTDFKNAWIRTVNQLRTVAGQQFKFLYNPNINQLNVDAWPANGGAPWPGDAYVDYAGCDTYFQNYDENNKTVDQIWNGEAMGFDGTFFTGGQGNCVLRSWNFIKAHGKVMFIPECGSGFKTTEYGNPAQDTYRWWELFTNWLQANTNIEGFFPFNQPADYTATFTKTSIYTGSVNGNVYYEENKNTAKAMRHFLGNVALKGELAYTVETVAPNATPTRTMGTITGMSGTGTTGDPIVIDPNQNVASGGLVMTLSSSTGTRIKYRSFTQNDQTVYGDPGTGGNKGPTITINTFSGQIRFANKPRRYLTKKRVPFGLRNDAGGSNTDVYIQVNALAPTLAATAAINLDNTPTTGLDVYHAVPTNQPSPGGKYPAGYVLSGRGVGGLTHDNGANAAINLFSLADHASTGDFAAFSINAQTGVVTVLDPTYLDHAIRTTVVFDIVADNSGFPGGGTATTTVTGTIFPGKAPPQNITVPVLSSSAASVISNTNLTNRGAVQNWTKSHTADEILDVSGPKLTPGSPNSVRLYWNTAFETAVKRIASNTTYLYAGQVYTYDMYVQHESANPTINQTGYNADQFFQSWGPGNAHQLFNISGFALQTSNGAHPNYTNDDGAGGSTAIAKWWNNFARCRQSSVSAATATQTLYMSPAQDNSFYLGKQGAAGEVAVQFTDLWGPGFLTWTIGTWTVASGTVTYLAKLYTSTHSAGVWTEQTTLLKGGTLDCMVDPTWYGKDVRIGITPEVDDGAGGFTQGTEIFSNVVQIAGFLPVPKTLATLSTQSPTQGVAITVTDADVNYYAYPTTIVARTYQWVRVTGTGGAVETEVNCTGTGATTASYTPNAGDAGSKLRCIITASNLDGSIPGTGPQTSDARLMRTLPTTNAVV